MANLDLWDKVRTVPTTAIKAITGGRLKGMSDINPTWRLKELTAQFGPCGVGWKYVITKQWLEVGGNDEIAAFVNIDLYIKVDGEWSDAIPGTGGSSFVAKESRGLYVSDECYKMALTDAISVACKALGMGADVYWDKDTTKYSKPEPPPKQPPKQQGNGEINWPNFWTGVKRIGYTEKQVHEMVGGSIKEYSREQLNQLIKLLKETKARELSEQSNSNRATD